MRRIGYVVLLMIFVAGCASMAVDQYQEIYGESAIVDRTTDTLAENQVDYWNEVQPILENRCVSCHACYDAPCQLKTTAVEGIDRGAINRKVYDVSRLTNAEPTRLFEDYFSTRAWRDAGFHPVLNEYADQSPEANLNASLLYRFLELKRQHAYPQEGVLPDEITLGLQRKEQCTDINGFDDFARDHPSWGMPYGLPALSTNEHDTLTRWVAQGARYTPRPVLSEEYTRRVADWEAFLNQNSLKAQLVSRYLYEHLYLANLYFEDLSERTFFNLVRSSSPPGQPVLQIATRRPYSDPGVDRVYYRLVEHKETIVAKTHKPFELNAGRMEFWKTLFFQPDYDVVRLPGYEPKVAGNPFVSFDQLPMASRYRFLLDEAHFIISNFVKGTVCRGQVAVNVIRDRFWVFFVDPDIGISEEIEAVVLRSQEDLELASTQEDVYLPLTNWVRYARKERNARKNRDRFLADAARRGEFEISLKNIWDGDGTNDNAALTVMRHFDYATVEKGLLGGTPQTAWVIGYPLLERIYYLLVAGYDVYGNVGHQLLSRIHMDFLRMDGEAAFLGMLPEASRIKERNNWHREAPREANEFLSNPELEKLSINTIPYTTSEHKTELLDMLRDRLSPVLDSQRKFDASTDAALGDALTRLTGVSGESAWLLPEISVIRFVGTSGSDRFVTVLKDVIHKNMSSMFDEASRIAIDETAVTVLDGVAGTYPNAFFRVPVSEAGQFVDRISRMQSSEDYAAVVDQYGVRRTDPAFWLENDLVHEELRDQSSVDYGVLDLSRYENR